jgi:hypothetical protein
MAALMVRATAPEELEAMLFLEFTKPPERLSMYT